MIKNFVPQYDFDDLLIQPAKLSRINSRSEVNPRYPMNKLPLITAPMDTVINKSNYEYFNGCGVMTVLPREKFHNGHVPDNKTFTSFSMDDFEKHYINTNYIPKEGERIRILIDVANGHMRRLYEMAKAAKVIYGDSMILMIGNVANPSTFQEYADIGVDMVRIGIGNGAGCLTSVQTGVGYSLASLITECHDIKRVYFYTTQIIADGGFKKYSDIIKALGLGADYVMLGSIFNKALESAGETTKENGEIINQYDDYTKTYLECNIPIYKTFRGMSTKEVQKTLGKEDLKTSEGVIRRNRVEYTLKGWIENFESYLRSAMSYTDKKELRDFIGEVNFNLITENVFKRFDK